MSFVGGTGTLYSKKARAVNESLMIGRDLRGASCCAFLAAVLFLVSAILYLIGFLKEWDSSLTDADDAEKYQELDVALLQRMCATAVHRGAFCQIRRHNSNLTGGRDERRATRPS